MHTRSCPGVEMFVLHTVRTYVTPRYLRAPINTDKLEEVDIKAAKDRMYASAARWGTMHRREAPQRVEGRAHITRKQGDQGEGHRASGVRSRVSGGALRGFMGDQRREVHEKPHQPVLVLTDLTLWLKCGQDPTIRTPGWIGLFRMPWGIARIRARAGLLIVFVGPVGFRSFLRGRLLVGPRPSCLPAA